VKGRQSAKRALETAAAGGQNLLMVETGLLLERERQTKGADLGTCKWPKPITKAVESRTRAVGLPFRLHQHERDGIASII
jgi:hypothetical protein